MPHFSMNYVVMHKNVPIHISIGYQCFADFDCGIRRKDHTIWFSFGEKHKPGITPDGDKNRIWQADKAKQYIDVLNKIMGFDEEAKLTVISDLSIYEDQFAKKYEDRWNLFSYAVKIPHNAFATRGQWLFMCTAIRMLQEGEKPLFVNALLTEYDEIMKATDQEAFMIFLKYLVATVKGNPPGGHSLISTSMDLVWVCGSVELFRKRWIEEPRDGVSYTLCKRYDTGLTSTEYQEHYKKAYDLYSNSITKFLKYVEERDKNILSGGCDLHQICKLVAKHAI